MNVFEDLIVELKEEHLLEETVFDTADVAASRVVAKNKAGDQETAHETDASEIAEDSGETHPEIVGNDEASETTESKSKKKRRQREPASSSKSVPLPRFRAFRWWSTYSLRSSEST